MAANSLQFDAYYEVPPAGNYEEQLRERADAIVSGQRAAIEQVRSRSRFRETNHTQALAIASQAAATFEPSIEGALQCPDCWVKRGRRSGLRQLLSQGQTAVFRCEHGETIPLRREF
jgi:hypothetical protein